ncbi:MAG TPA: hypothetical protein VK576_06210, partial [Thermoleophilia bacterium]|nr:hypothetical protein [Thermoleophilia bacterium]
MSVQRFIREDCGREFEESLVGREDDVLASPFYAGLDLQPVGEIAQDEASYRQVATKTAPVPPLVPGRWSRR